MFWVRITYLGCKTIFSIFVLSKHSFAIFSLKSSKLKHFKNAEQTVYAAKSRKRLLRINRILRKPKGSLFFIVIYTLR